MSKQNFKNHVRIVPAYHFFISLLIVAFLVGSIITFIHTEGNLKHAALMLIIAAFVLIGLFWYARSFALKAQDRAIRAEENLRHYILTGKPLDKKLHLGQIIALRFASDEELPALAIKAVEEDLSPKQIKQDVVNWRADYHRV